MLPSPLCPRESEHESLVQGVAGRARRMRVNGKHSPAAHCDFACGRSGLSCNGGGSDTSQAPWCTEWNSLDARLSMCTTYPTYIRGICAPLNQRDRGGCRVGWVGRLARYRPGFNAHREAGSPPPPPLPSLLSRVLRLSTPSAVS